MTTMTGTTDLEFLQALEACTLPPEEFGHAAHLRAAYLYASAHEFPEALAHMRRALQAYCAALGKSDRYDEAITTAFMALVVQRLHACGDSGGWDGFARDHADLFDRGLLLRLRGR